MSSVRFRKPLSFLALALAILVAGTIVLRKSAHARLPKYEGRTFDEWVAEFAQRYPGVYVLDEVDAKEAELVFRSMGASAQQQLIKEYVQHRPLTGIRAWLVSVGWRLPAACTVGPFRDRMAPRWSVCRDVLERIRPEWEVFKPVYDEFVERDDEYHLRGMLDALQYVGGNSGQLVPILIDGLTNSNETAIPQGFRELVRAQGFRADSHCGQIPFRLPVRPAALSSP